MKAYRIDVVNKRVEQVEVDSGNVLQGIYEHTGCRCVDIVRIDGRNTIYVDDEGLLNGAVHRLGLFKVQGTVYAQVLAGHGLVLAVNGEGESIAPTLSLEEVRAMISFPSLQEAAAMEPDER